MKKITLIAIFLSHFFVFLNTNQVFGQKRDNPNPNDCKIEIDGEIKLYSCETLSRGSSMQYRTYGQDEARRMGSTGGYERVSSGFGTTITQFFSVGDSDEKIRLFSTSLAPYIKGVPEAESLLHKNKMLTIVRATSIVGGIVGVIYFIKYPIETQGEYQLYIKAAPLFAIVLAGHIINRICIKASKKNIINAIKAYNGAKVPKTSLLEALKPDYLTLGNAQGTAGVSIGWHLSR